MSSSALVRTARQAPNALLCFVGSRTRDLAYRIPAASLAHRVHSAPPILREAIPDWFKTDYDVPFMLQVH